MRAYKTVVWDGQEYSVPVKMRWLTVDSDGEVCVWSAEPIRVFYDTPLEGFWKKNSTCDMVSLTKGDDFSSWRESLKSI